MPSSASKQNRKKKVAPPPYDPNSEKEQSIQSAAHHWELLRRNTAFKEVVHRWVANPAFRIKHSESADYHHSQTHFPRCALDWMISGPARSELARIQLAAGRWYRDSRFNFGPIIVEQTRPAVDVYKEPIPNVFTVQPLPDAPPPLRLEQTWPDTLGLFRQQFSLAIHQGIEFQVVTQNLRETASCLRSAAAHLHRKDAPEKLPQIAQQLFEFSRWFHDLASFHHVFAIPSQHCAPGKFKEHLAAIRKHCDEARQVFGGYSAHASWLGTKDQWRYFLIAEQKGYDAKNTTHMYELARLYSEDLKRGLYEGTVRRDTKRHSFIGANVPSKAIKNRRSTVREFITGLQEWITNIYPPDLWLAFTRPPAQKSSKEIPPAS